MIGVNEESMQDEYKEAQEGETDIDKKIKLGELNEPDHEDLIFFINTSSVVRNVAF